jgi:transposase
MKKSYSTDLTGAKWECIKPYVAAPSKRGRPRIHNTRIILDANFYVLRGGCPWRLLPRDFPPWSTVYRYYFRRRSLDCTWEREQNDPRASELTFSESAFRIVRSENHYEEPLFSPATSQPSLSLSHTSYFWPLGMVASFSDAACSVC